MALPLTKLYERSKIGPTTELAFTDASFDREELVDDVAAGQNNVAPVVFLLRTTDDVHLRQGNNSVVATTDDFLLVGGAYYQILVEDKRDNHLAAIAPSGGSGIIFITKASEV